jgi:hypothetical protein
MSKLALAVGAVWCARTAMTVRRKAMSSWMCGHLFEAARGPGQKSLENKFHIRIDGI